MVKIGQKRKIKITGEAKAFIRASEKQIIKAEQRIKETLDKVATENDINIFSVNYKTLIMEEI